MGSLSAGLFSSLLLLAAVACSSPDSGPASVSISPQTSTLGTWGGTAALSAEVKNAAGDRVSATGLTWSSSAPAIAQVDSRGNVTGVRPGTATIMASIDGLTAMAVVTIAQMNAACVTPAAPVTPGNVAPVPAFAPMEITSVPAAIYSPGLVSAIDFDGDSDQDVVVAENSYPGDMPYDQRFALYRNDGGTLVDVTTTAWTGSSKADHARDFEVADFDGDGRQDVYFAAHGYDAVPFPGSPNALMLSAGTVSGFIDGSDRLAGNPSSFTHASASADVDCDGDIDLYEGNAFDGGESAALPAPRLLVNDGTAHFTSMPANLPSALTTYLERYLSAELCDVDRDGDPDVILGGFGAPSHLLMNDGFGRFLEPPEPMLPMDAFGGIGQDIESRCVDLDRDGWPDLVMLELDKPFADSSGPVQRRELVWRNRGDGTFEDVTSAWIPALENVGFMTVLRPIDLNNDGWIDFILANGESAADRGILVNDGSRLLFTQIAAAAGPTYGEALFELDLNNDSRLDLYLPRPHYTPVVYLQP